MSLRIAISDMHVRRLSDAVLVSRLTRDVVAGIDSGKPMALVGGCLIPLGDGDKREYSYALSRQNPGTATVVRHDDGSVDVTLSHSVSVWLAPSAVSR